MKFKDYIKQYKLDGLQYVKIGRRYYETNVELENFRQKINRDVFSVGVYLGEEKNDFRPTSYFIELLSKNCDSVEIGKKAEWLFLCNRDVFAEGIIKYRDPGFVIVKNKEQEILGIGELQIRKGSPFLKNKLDKGEYLRREN